MSPHIPAIDRASYIVETEKRRRELEEIERVKAEQRKLEAEQEARLRDRRADLIANARKAMADLPDLYKRRAEAVARLAAPLWEVWQLTSTITAAEGHAFDLVRKAEPGYIDAAAIRAERLWENLRREIGLPPARHLGLPSPPGDAERLAATVAILIARGMLGPSAVAVSGRGMVFEYDGREV